MRKLSPEGRIQTKQIRISNQKLYTIYSSEVTADLPKSRNNLGVGTQGNQVSSSLLFSHHTNHSRLVSMKQPEPIPQRPHTTIKWHLQVRCKEEAWLECLEHQAVQAISQLRYQGKGRVHLWMSHQLISQPHVRIWASVPCFRLSQHCSEGVVSLSFWQCLKCRNAGKKG